HKNNIFLGQSRIFFCFSSHTDFCRCLNYIMVRFNDLNVFFNVCLQDCVSPPVLIMLTVLFGALTVILLSVLIFIILNHRKTHTDAKAEDNE
ncbi:Ig kappa chain V19-17-like, partial [Clarias magur]